MSKLSKNLYKARLRTTDIIIILRLLLGDSYIVNLVFFYLCNYLFIHL